MNPETRFTPEQFTAWTDASERLLAGEPMQYILGECWFGELKLQVRPGVLIPRPETEEVALTGRTLLENRPDPAPYIYKVLDVGCGSGCIALYLAHHLRGAEVWAADVSDTALEVTTQNAGQLQLPLQVHRADARALPSDWPAFDLIISNPPYIPRHEQAEMKDLVTEHEPELALFVPDDDPLLFYRHIAHYARTQLKPGGFLVFEIHEDYGAECELLLNGIGFVGVTLRNDLQGKPRILYAEQVKT